VDSKTDKSSTIADLIARTKERMTVYVSHPPERRAEEVRKVGKTK
jgi:hypothetical protein